MYKYKVLLVGASGRGKTYSFRNMDRNKTGFINVENKPLPFKGTFKHMLGVTKSSDVLTFIASACNHPEIDCIVIDSFSAYIDMLMLEARATKVGWDIMNHYNENIGKFNDAVKKANKEVFVTAHYEIITDEVANLKERRTKTKGKEWEGVIEKDYTIVLFAEAKVEFGEEKPKHFFTLYNDGTSSAKTPPGIFDEGLTKIDNDCNLVLQKIREFQK